MSASSAMPASAPLRRIAPAADRLSCQASPPPDGRLHLGQHPARRAADGGELGGDLAQALAGDDQHAGELALAVAGRAAVADGEVLGVRVFQQAVFEGVGEQARQVAALGAGQQHLEPQALGAGEDDLALGGGGPVAGLGVALGGRLPSGPRSTHGQSGRARPLFVDGEEEAVAHNSFCQTMVGQFWLRSREHFMRTMATPKRARPVTKWRLVVARRAVSGWRRGCAT